MLPKRKPSTHIERMDKSPGVNMNTVPKLEVGEREMRDVFEL